MASRLFITMTPVVMMWENIVNKYKGCPQSNRSFEIKH